MNAADVIAAQTELLYRLTEHDVDGWVAQHGGETPLMGYLIRLAARETGSTQLGKALARAYQQTLHRARAYRVQENMTAVLAARARALPADATVSDGRRPPRPYGLARLDEPLRFRNTQGQAQAAHWVGWARFVGPKNITGWVLTLWDDISTEPDETVKALWMDARKDLTYDEVVAGHWRMFGRWAPITIGYVIADAPIGESHGTSPIGGPEPTFTIRAIVTLWEMLGETVPARETGDHVEHIDRTDEHLPRTVARRARRDGLDDPGVTTVVLRREHRAVRNPGTGTPWDSRIWVEGYEAWRWIGPRHDRRRVRRWIPGHWSVNNEELPVRQRKIVSELRR